MFMCVSHHRPFYNSQCFDAQHQNLDRSTPLKIILVKAPPICRLLTAPAENLRKFVLQDPSSCEHRSKGSASNASFLTQEETTKSGSKGPEQSTANRWLGKSKCLLRRYVPEMVRTGLCPSSESHWCAPVHCRVASGSNQVDSSNSLLPAVCMCKESFSFQVI